MYNAYVKKKKTSSFQLDAEKFDVPSLIFVSEIPLALYPLGLTDGIVVSSGGGKTCVSGIIVIIFFFYINNIIGCITSDDSFQIESLKLDFGGRDMTDLMISLLQQKPSAKNFFFSSRS